MIVFFNIGIYETYSIQNLIKVYSIDLYYKCTDPLCYSLHYKSYGL